MQLKILGCGSIYSKDNSASCLIDEKILLDVPNGTCKILKNIGIEPSTITHVLITHFHGDHFFDIPFMLLNKILNNSEIIDIYCDETGETKIQNITTLAFPNKVEKIKKHFNYVYDKQFNIGKYKIEKIAVEHEEGIQSYGYIFTENNINIGFTGDVCICKGVHEMAEKCNHLICDCTAMNGTKSHIGVDNIIELANKYPNCNFYTTHMADGVREKIRSLNIKNLNSLQDNEELLF